MRVLRAAALLAGALVVVIAAVLVTAGQQADAPAVALPPPMFVEQAQAAGITHVYEGDFDYIVGGGVAAFDCNGDGRVDLYFAGGTNAAALYRNESGANQPLEFVPVADPVVDLEGVVGAYPLDVDGDGLIDLAILRRGENVLARGLGDCRFERANEQWHFDGRNTWSTSFSATWEAGSSWPTLAVGNYLDEARSTTENRCFDNELFRPGSDGSGFAPPTPLSPGWCALSMLFSSWDRSGRADLRISNDRHYYTDYSAGEEQLWRVAPGEQPRLYGSTDGWQTVRVNGMGIGAYDVTGDGYPDYYLTSQADNKLQTMAGSADRPEFMDIALRRGVTATRPYTGDINMPSTSWHAQFEDVNNDGLIDLFVAKGNVEAQPDYAARDPNDLFLGQPDGTFEEAAGDAGLAFFAQGRGAAIVDLDGDGLLELIVVNRHANVSIWRNLGAPEGMPRLGNWLGVRLMQDGPNRYAIGAWLEVRSAGGTERREVTIGGGQASGQLVPFHFGLNRSTSAQVRVTWPDGTISDWHTVEANHVIDLTP